MDQVKNLISERYRCTYSADWIFNNIFAVDNQVLALMDYPELGSDKRTHDYLLTFATTVNLWINIYEFIGATKLLLNHIIFGQVFKEHLN